MAGQVVLAPQREATTIRPGAVAFCGPSSVAGRA